MDLHWTGTIDIGAILTVIANAVVAPVLVLIWRGIVYLVREVKWCVGEIKEIREWQEQHRDFADETHSNELRLTRIETVLDFIIPESVQDARIAQVFRDSIKKPVSKEDAAKAAKLTREQRLS
jgi:hypothetical protein